MTAGGSIWLASASPRRRQLLEQAGLSVRVRPSDLDDAMLRRGSVSPSHWVMALAYFKARRVFDALRRSIRAGAEPFIGTVLGADTVCVNNSRMFGQPRDEDHARGMLLSMRNAAHWTVTGVCLLPLDGVGRMLFADRAEVHVGAISDAQIQAYLASGHWRGKAGAYNLSERIADGWPIQCYGDPATVMGLPMRRLLGTLEALEA